MKASEKLGVYGARSLSDLEVLETIVGHTGGARELWDRCEQDLSRLSSITAFELRDIQGVGDATSKKIKAAMELGLRAMAPTSTQKDKEGIATPVEMVRFLRSHCHGRTQEEFMVVGLNARMKVTTVRTVAIGSLAQVDVHPRELFRPLIRNGVQACVLAHNHPSGESTPSEADYKLTARMVEVGKLVGIPVVDHVVFSNTDSTSLAALGFLD